MALFPPGKGGGEGVARGGKGKGILIHSLTEGGGMPLANRTTPANGDERAQVLPLLDAVKIRTGKRGRPRKRLHVIVGCILTSNTMDHESIPLLIYGPKCESWREPGMPRNMP